MHSAPDSIRVKSPLPGGLSALFRLAFNAPQWAQVTGAILGAIIGLGILALLWIRRGAIIDWLRSRPQPIIIALVSVLVIFVSAFAGGSAYLWHYTQHDNGFCTGCHVMETPYNRFTVSEHSKLECHSCHQLPITASMWQLVLWVAERPDKIPSHARVPNRVCASCHITGQKEVWQRIASTAGHRVHLESDSSALRGVQCVTCHGVEVHHFAPASQTCGSAGCHDRIKITLGRMQSQTSLHCVSCHQFTADVPALATRDSAAGTLVPGEHQCLACHQMQTRAGNFDAAKDPHNGTCGKCHNPHTQRVASDAAKTCAACHSDWRKIPFHTGVRHRDVATNCILCHEPHQARVDPSDCAGCHQVVKGRRAGSRTLAPPVPFDTLKALQSSSIQTRDSPHGPMVLFELPATFAPQPSPTADTFPHDRHSKIECVVCHASDRQHGRLTFDAPRGCMICHHQSRNPAAPITGNAIPACQVCHTGPELSAQRPETLHVAVAGAERRVREVSFSHESHRLLACAECHRTPVTLDPDAKTRDCTGCHDRHHTGNVSCSPCHRGNQLQSAHQPPEAIHTACSRCHKSELVAALMPDRKLCLSCHSAQADHYADRQCTTCHFQESPEEFRKQMIRAPA